jgi:hypothetical protein
MTLVREIDVALERFKVRVAVVVLSSIVVDIVCAVIVYYSEKGAKNEFDTIWQALFWTTTQLLTVSSQLPNPENTATKFVDVFMEIWGVLVIAGAAGIVADLLHHRTRHRVFMKQRQQSR